MPPGSQKLAPLAHCLHMPHKAACRLDCSAGSSNTCRATLPSHAVQEMPLAAQRRMQQIQ
jgi:hypothetical protein